MVNFGGQEWLLHVEKYNGSTRHRVRLPGVEVIAKGPAGYLHIGELKYNFADLNAVVSGQNSYS